MGRVRLLFRQNGNKRIWGGKCGAGRMPAGGSLRVICFFLLANGKAA